MLWKTDDAQTNNVRISQVVKTSPNSNKNPTFIRKISFVISFPHPNHISQLNVDPNVSSFLANCSEFHPRQSPRRPFLMEANSICLSFGVHLTTRAFCYGPLKWQHPSLNWVQKKEINAMKNCLGGLFSLVFSFLFGFLAGGIRNWNVVMVSVEYHIFLCFSLL